MSPIMAREWVVCAYWLKDRRVFYWGVTSDGSLT